MSKKNLDQKGRIRNKIVSFRMSEEEVKLLDRRVLLSGLTKQDYIINSLLGKEIAVYGNPYVFRSLHDELMKLINIYGMKIEDEDDEEIIALTLKTILAMRKKRKNRDFSAVKCFQKCFHRYIEKCSKAHETGLFSCCGNNYS